MQCRYLIQTNTKEPSIEAIIATFDEKVKDLVLDSGNEYYPSKKWKLNVSYEDARNFVGEAEQDLASVGEFDEILGEAALLLIKDLVVLT